MTTVAMLPRFLETKTPSAGVEGSHIEEAIAAARRWTRATAQNWESYIESAIAEISAECSVRDWNGNDAEPIRRPVLERAREIAEVLYRYVPMGTSPPDLTPEPDGEVLLTWARTADLVFSISVGDHALINYAGRLGKGVEPHDAVSFDLGDPAKIMQLASFISTVYR